MATSTCESTRRRPAAHREASVSSLRPGPSGDGTVADLLRRAAGGNEAAWCTVVDRYSSLLWAVVRGFRFPEAQAADVVQATWLRLLENLDAIRDPERLAGWLRTTARRECFEAIRHNGREHLSDPHAHHMRPATEPVSDRLDADPEASVLHRERADLVRAALRDLPEHSQQMLGLLVACPPVSYEEIGARLGMPVGSIGPTRARLLARLRTTLAAADIRAAA